MTRLLVLALCCSALWGGTVTSGYAISLGDALSPVYFTGVDDSGNDVTAEIFAGNMSDVPSCPLCSNPLTAFQVGDMEGYATINGIAYGQPAGEPSRFVDGHISCNGTLPPLPVDPSLVGTSIVLAFTSGCNFDLMMYDTDEPITYGTQLLFAFSGTFGGVGTATGRYEIDNQGNPYFEGSDFVWGSIPTPTPEPSPLVTTMCGLVALKILSRCGIRAPRC
ncbi:MAG TPA: hypothetical protein VHU90_02180 [Galbitalea sp.]|nr:hypothetical protein [Galbitalea sp.]